MRNHLTDTVAEMTDTVTPLATAADLDLTFLKREPVDTQPSPYFDLFAEIDSVTAARLNEFYGSEP